MTIKTIIQNIKKSRKTLAVAESCTGGRLSAILTSMPKSSDYFKAGIIPYQEKQKINILKVSPKILAKHKAVSEAVSVELAKNVKSLTKSDIGIGITGFAGPDKGNKNNPKGTVYITIYTTKPKSYRFMFKGSRNKIQNQAAKKALELINKNLF